MMQTSPPFLSPMRLHFLPVVFSLALFTPAAGFAQQEHDAPPVDLRQLLQELKQIEAKSSASSKGRQQKVLSDLSAAAASGSRATDFYEQAIRATRFAGQAQQQTQFQEWKKKEAEKLRSHDMQTAVQLHLQYLVITLKHAWGTPMEETLPALFQYTHQLTPLLADKGKRPFHLREPLMSKPLGESVFVQWYGLGGDLPAAKGWELAPIKLDGMYEKTILPIMRKQKDARIVQYWDMRIEREARQAEEDRRTFGQDQFNFVKKPDLLWSRAKDLLVVGQKNRAMTEMLAVIRAYPDHPEALARIAELEKLATPPAVPASEPTSEPAP